MTLGYLKNLVNQIPDKYLNSELYFDNTEISIMYDNQYWYIISTIKNCKQDQSIGDLIFYDEEKKLEQ